MTENSPDDYSPELNPWFSTHLKYEGWGKAEFYSPKGIAEGPVKLEFTEQGEGAIEMNVTIDHIMCDVPLPFGLQQFFSASQPTTVNDLPQMPLVFETNSCIKLSIETEEGTFSAETAIYYHFGYHMDFRDASKNRANLKFGFMNLRFISKNNLTPKYWVIPLTNYCASLRQQINPALNRHPLRIYKPKDVPDIEDDNARMFATIKANAKNKLIVFPFNGDAAFIEGMPDMEDRIQKLQVGKERSLITALMVGVVGDHSTHPDEVENWMPFEVFSLLGLCTGSFIGSPWIEFRDVEGKLAERIHFSLHCPNYFKGQVNIDEGFHGGTSRLITQALSSGNLKDKSLKATLERIILAGDQSTLSEQFGHAVIGLDCLIREYGLQTQYLLKSLDADKQKLVKGVLLEAADKVKAIRIGADMDQQRVLEQIGGRILHNPANVDSDFGLAVVALLKKFNLPDADLVDTHYAAHPRPDKTTSWHKVISFYRGESMHRGFFDLTSDKYEFQDIYKIMNHLVDILLRIVLKQLNYDGTYQPRCLNFKNDQRADWVTDKTPSSLLGYGQMEQLSYGTMGLVEAPILEDPIKKT